MKLLHHPESELSRNLMTTAPIGVEVIEGHGEYTVSAYPSVVVTRDSREVYEPRYDDSGGLLGMELTAYPEYEEIIRMPASWEAVYDYVNFS